MEDEVFVEIEGCPGYYVSNLGRVKSTKRKEEHIMSQRATKYGYMTVMICLEGQLTSFYTARLVLAAFEGYPTDPWLCVARHLNGNTRDCRLENLEWEICQTNFEYNPHLSHRRGVLKPDTTKDKMSQAKFNQSEETIRKQMESRARTIGRRRWYYE